jgi:hypothetical protein
MCFTDKGFPVTVLYIFALHLTFMVQRFGQNIINQPFCVQQTVLLNILF